MLVASSNFVSRPARIIGRGGQSGRETKEKGVVEVRGWLHAWQVLEAIMEADVANV